MNALILIIIGSVGVFLGWYFGRRRALKKHGNQRVEKRKNKEDIGDYLKRNERITNNDVERLLGVSDATATRYLEELEKEGKVRQVGETGKGVYYVLK